MKNNYWVAVLTLCLIYLFTPQALAQVIEGCAASRLYAEARTAIATPKHVKRMNQYDITFYGLDLQLERNSVFIAGTVTLEAKLTGARLDTFAFELHPNFQIESVVINGIAQQTIVRNAGDVSVRLSNTIQAPGKVKAVITYNGSAPKGASAAIGNGFTSSFENTFNKQVTWSLSEPYAAYEWWPTKQVLTDKADSVHVFVTTNADNKVGSNGLLTRTVNLPNGKKRFEWKSNYPIAYYLVSVAVSDYTEYLIYANPAGAASPVPILNYVYSNEALDRFKEQINLTAPFLEYYSDIFTLYPFHKEKYGHSMAPMGGGMEHQTMTTQATFTFTLTAHELAHQWFGNNVTCASWRDIWLNEGFASYAEYLALQQFKPQDAPAWMLSAHEFALDVPNGSVLVDDTTNVSRIFNYRLTYKKAAAVVHMLRNEINNDALFFESLRKYQRQYQDSTATTADLQRVFEKTTGLDLDYFFEQWLAGSGYPVFAVEWNQKGQNVLLVSRQSTSSNTSFFRTTMEYRIRAGSIDTTIRVTHNKPIEQYLIKLDKDAPISDVTVDPNNWVLNKLTRVVQNPALNVPDQLAIKPILFPNPAYATLIVEGIPFQATTAILYDRIGRKLWQEQFQQTNKVQVDVQHLLPGLYILHLSDGRSHYQTSFIKVDRP